MKKESLSYKFYKISLLVFLMLISAFNYNLFINPTKIVAGGVNGISTVLEEIFNFNPAITMLIISTLILLIACIFREYELVIGALLASVIYPFFVGITSTLNGVINIKQSDLLIVAVFSGIISGFIAGTICKLGTSQGGTTLLSQILSKRLKVSTAKVNVIISGIIVILGAIIFGTSNILLAVVYLFSSRMVMDKIILGISQNKLFQIITKEEKAITEYITKYLNSGVTTFKTKGGFELNKKIVVMTSISNRDYFRFNLI